MLLILILRNALYFIILNTSNTENLKMVAIIDDL